MINLSATDHTQSIAGSSPILALDMYEHAYHIEFGANPSAYVAAFMRNIDWRAVERRNQDAIIMAPPPLRLEQREFGDLPLGFQRLDPLTDGTLRDIRMDTARLCAARWPAITPEDVQAMIKSGEGVQLIDTRPRHYTTRGQDIAEGAAWRDPERIEEAHYPKSCRSSPSAATAFILVARVRRRYGRLVRCPLHGRRPLRLESA